MSHKQLMSSQNMPFGGDSSFAQLPNDAKFYASGNQSRKKLPIGFLVQQEKRELHKMGIHASHTFHSQAKSRPDSAKITYG